MECESQISFNTNCSIKTELIDKAFSAFKGMNPGSWKDIAARKDAFKEAIAAAGLELSEDDIYNHLDMLDTGVTEVEVKKDKISIGIFPMDFPEELCRLIFPVLENAGFTDIKCNSDSEYGSQILNYKNGRVSKKEDMFEM